MHIQESGEMYLETIHVLYKKTGAVRAIDVGEYMGYSKPSVSRAMGILKSAGYIEVDKHGYITLTEAGLSVANRMYERHTLLTEFLVHLGVTEEVAADDACKIEHHISEKSFDAIKKFIEESRK
jgi:Mn-dependent DtxR family transcriptional regulator